MTTRTNGGLRTEKHECPEVLVLGFFKGDTHKTDLWFRTPNPLLGEITPLAYWDLKGVGALTKFIKHQISGNVRPAKPKRRKP